MYLYLYLNLYISIYIYIYIYQYIYIYIYIQVGFAQTAALQETLQRKVLFRFFFPLKFVACFYISEHVLCVLLDTFSSGRVPPDAPGGAKVSLGGASGDQVCFFIDF